MLSSPFENTDPDVFAEGQTAFSVIASSKSNHKPQTTKPNPLTACVLFCQDNAVAREYAFRVSRIGQDAINAFKQCPGKVRIFTEPPPPREQPKPFSDSYKRCRCDLAIRQRERDDELTKEKKRRREERQTTEDDISSGSGSEYNDMNGFPDYNRNDNDDDDDDDDDA
jgi:hypothetical protein